MERKKDLALRGSVVDRTLQLLDSIIKDENLPAPGGDDFRKMLGVHMVIYHNLASALLAESGSKPKLDRDMLRLALRVFEMSDKAASLGINSLDKGKGEG